MEKDTDQIQEFNKMSISKRMRFADGLGEQVGKILNAAVRRANKVLAVHGFSVSIEMKFHEIKGEN